MKHESEFDKEKKIDIYNLHKEWQNQSQVAGKWLKYSAKASKERFKAEERLKATRIEVKRDVEEVRAQLDFEIRQEETWKAEDFEKKPTEVAIQGWIIQQERYKEANKKADEKVKQAVDELADAIEDEDFLKGAALIMGSHRKAGIEGEVSLWLGGYFSDPKIPKELKETHDKIVQKKIRRKLQT